MDYGMFSTEGNQAVDSMITVARGIRALTSIDNALDFAKKSLNGMSEQFEEANDTAVREAVYFAIVGDK